MIVCLCGSLRFESVFRKKSQELALQGDIVLAPAFGLRGLSQSQIHSLVGLHCRKIAMSDQVFVINPGNYIGKYTLQEIEYALSIGKPVFYAEVA